MAADIKIFVSHRIDQSSELIPNPLYIPVRCGAVYDTGSQSPIAGDDTGDNISRRRMSFCEFTVQYWAWKNCRADYYGLCHYRRYLSFAQSRFAQDKFGMIPAYFLDHKSEERFGLLDVVRMRDEIASCDAILSEPSDVTIQPTPKGRVPTVRALWEAHDGLFLTVEAIDEMFRQIDRLSPEYSQSARAYFDSSYHRGYNCFIMRRELFDRLCAFQFPILFEMERWLVQQPYRDSLPRIPGYVGEILYGIFTYHISTCENWNIELRQLVLFRYPQHIYSRGERCQLYVQDWLVRHLRTLADVLLPLGSKRRMAVKKRWNDYKRLHHKERN